VWWVKNKQYMDSSDTDKQLNENEQTKTSNNMSNVGDVFQPLWLRCSTGDVNKFNWQLLESQFSIVLPCGILFWAVLLIFG
jgi:hypothetical protein